MKAKVFITYKDGILDPEGNTVCKALQNIGLDKIDTVQFGKYIELTFSDADKTEAEILTDAACRKLLANHNTEQYRFEVVDE